MKALLITVPAVTLGIIGATILWQPPPSATIQTAVIQPSPDDTGDRRSGKPKLTAGQHRPRTVKVAASRAEPPASTPTVLREEDLALDEQLREEAEDRHYIEQLTAHYAAMEDDHLQQPVDSHWARAKREQLATSFATTSLTDSIDLAMIDCRSDSCILDFALATASAESATTNTHFFEWLLGNTEGCELHGEGAVSSEDPDANITQRVYLVNCS